MSQAQSRKKLIVVLLFGAVLLAAPLLWQAWTTSHELDGKVAAFDAPSAKPAKDLLACLVQRPAGGLKLTIMAANHFADPDRRLTVRIEPRDQGARLKAWIGSGGALTSGEMAQLKTCAGN